jgi:hypothetical protein
MVIFDNRSSQFSSLLYRLTADSAADAVIGLATAAFFIHPSAFILHPSAFILAYRAR